VQTEELIDRLTKINRTQLKIANWNYINLKQKKSPLDFYI
jgi:hypothetical protein